MNLRADAVLPMGIVTFLFTDIEGSTRLWEAHPDVMRVALARHDALMRETIVGANGHVFRTVGDAFCTAIDSKLGDRLRAEDSPARVHRRRASAHTATCPSC